MAFSFDLGRYHATPWGSHVNEGAVEWPPSPWRIMRALFAASRTHVNLEEVREDFDRSLTALAAAPPPVYELPWTTLGHTRHYYPSRAYSPSKPGETDRVIDGFRVVRPSDELRVWWDVTLDDRARAALAATTRALGHLGRSESACTARLADREAPNRVDAAPESLPGRSASSDTVELLCLESRDPMTAMAVSVQELRRKRLSMPPGTRRQAYAVNAPEPRTQSSVTRDWRPQLASFRVLGGSRPPLLEAVAVCQGLRRALQSRYGTANEGAGSRVFGGKDADGPRRDQHRHAHYLALPDADGRRVGRLLVWAPEGFGPREVAALSAVHELRMRDAPDSLRLGLTALGRTAELSLPSVLGPSRHWRSLTPFGLVRHPKRRGGREVDTPEEQLVSELGHRELPQPSDIRRVRGRWLEFRRTRVGTSKAEAPRVLGFEIEFPEPVRGPLALGALCHFGLGVFVPTELTGPKVERCSG